MLKAGQSVALKRGHDRQSLPPALVGDAALRAPDNRCPLPRPCVINTCLTATAPSLLATDSKTAGHPEQVFLSRFPEESCVPVLSWRPHLLQLPLDGVLVLLLHLGHLGGRGSTQLLRHQVVRLRAGHHACGSTRVS